MAVITNGKIKIGAIPEHKKALALEYKGLF